MIKSLIDQQTKKLVAHMNDYQQATQLQQKGEAAIFNRYRLPEGGFADGLREDLANYRKSFADEWGAEGWRNEQFVKQQIAEVQRQTNEQREDTHSQSQAGNQDADTQREEFLNNLKNTQKQQAQRGQKPH